METPVSLLERLRLRPGPEAWQRLTDLYAPLVRSWVARDRLQPADADDVCQEVMAVVVRELPQFRHDLRRGAFRRWLAPSSSIACGRSGAAGAGKLVA